MVVSEEARKLRTVLDYSSTSIHREDLIQAALDAAEKRGREETLRRYGSNLHNHNSTCPDCSALVEKGREEKLVEVLEEARSSHSQDDYDMLLRFKSLQPPKPAVPPVPEWFKKFSFKWNGGMTPCQVQGMWEIYLAHAPKVDAGGLASAIGTRLIIDGVHGTRERPVPARFNEILTAAIREKLEGRK